MRASSFSLVISTTYSLLWASGVRGQPPDDGGGGVESSQKPTIIQPLNSMNGGPYTISWTGCNAPTCAVVNVNIIEVDIFTLESRPTYISTLNSFTIASCATDGGASSTPCAVGHLHGSFPSRLLTVDISWNIGGSTINSTVPITTSTPGLIAPGPTVSTSTPLGPSSGTAPITSAATPTLASSSITPGAISSPTSIIPASSSTDSSSLSTGAKVGIAVGVIGFALLALIAVLLLCCCRRRQRKHRTLPNGMPYSHDIDSTNRDLAAEKEMHVISSPVDTLHNGYSSIPPAAAAAAAAEAENRSPGGSRAMANYPTRADAIATTAVPYTDAHHHHHRGSHGSGYEDSTLQTPDSQQAQHAISPTAAAATGAAAIQRKPVGVAAAAASGPTHHLREPGMSEDEVARLEEEERRIDEAIAEAERRRPS